MSSVRRVPAKTTTPKSAITSPKAAPRSIASPTAKAKRKVSDPSVQPGGTPSSQSVSGAFRSIASEDGGSRHVDPAASDQSGNSTPTTPPEASASLLPVSPSVCPVNQQQTGRVQVSVRIRPLNKADGSDSKVVVRKHDLDATTIEVNDLTKSRKRTFTYDNVFTESQEEVFQTIGTPMLEETLKGYNTTLFAYGQTGSGKTYSVLGDDGGLGQGADVNQVGLIPRFARRLFEEAQLKMEEDPQLTVKIVMSFFEIYQERVRDLLVPKVKDKEPESLEIYEVNHKVFVRNLTLHTVISIDRVLELIALGNSNRQTAETKMNEHSSRSHSIVQFSVSQVYDQGAVEKRDLEAQVNLVDLAGSERQGKTETTGEHFEEAKRINYSLLMLGRVLNSFSEGRREFVSLRESKLTRLLSESFGGNSKTWMLATVSPSQYNVQESISTLEYASNAKKITNKATVNKLARTMEIKELKEAVSRLEDIIDSERAEHDGLRQQYRQLERENAELRKKVEDLSAQCRDRSRPVTPTATPTAPVLSPPPFMAQTPRHPGLAQNLFVGRCHVSLGSVLQRETRYLTMPLSCEGSAVPGVGCYLLLQIYPVDLSGHIIDDSLGNKKDESVINKRVDFVIHILGARCLPESHTNGIYCKYVFKMSEQDVFRTPEVAGTTDPDWNFKKRFAFQKVTPTLAQYFNSDNVITFEVIGKPESSSIL